MVVGYLLCYSSCLLYYLLNTHNHSFIYLLRVQTDHSFPQGSTGFQGTIYCCVSISFSETIPEKNVRRYNIIELLSAKTCNCQTDILANGNPTDSSMCPVMSQVRNAFRLAACAIRHATPQSSDMHFVM